MTLPASGQLSLAQIAAEFGGTAPHSLSEYYRGGGLVPDIPVNAAIPTSGPISFSNFYGAAAHTENIGDGALVVAGEQVAGVGALGRVGAGVLVVAGEQVAGVGALGRVGAGALNVSSRQLSGVGAAGHPGAGALTRGAPLVSGSGTVTPGLATDNVVLTAGYNAAGGAFVDFYGFRAAPQSPVIGSLVSGTGWLPGGVSIEVISSTTPTASPSLRTQEVFMVGFSSNPGASFFTSVTIGGVTRLTSGATYNYFSGAGRATWSWPNQATGWPFTNGVNATAVFEH